MQQASCLEGGPLLWIWPLYLHVNKKSDDDDDRCLLNTGTFQMNFKPGRVAQSVGHLTRKSGVLRSIPGLATYFRFSFRFFKKGSCQLLAKVCAQSTG